MSEENISTGWDTAEVEDGGEMRLFFARPGGTESRLPGVIVLQEAFGVNAHIQDVTQRIAALGYAAAAPELFHRTAPGFEGDYRDLGQSKPHMQALTPKNIESDVKAAQRRLESEAGADGLRMAAVGFCLGGKAAFVANAVLRLQCAASFYGSGIPGLLEEYADRQKAKLLLVWGGKDKHIDAVQRAGIAEKLREGGKPFIQAEFSDAEHGFFCDERQAYNPEAALEAWALLAAFLENRLRR